MNGSFQKVLIIKPLRDFYAPLEAFVSQEMLP